MQATDIVIKPLSPELKADFLTFFDGAAFADNPEWASCYCVCYYQDHKAIKWSERTAQENRSEASDRVDRGRMLGHLAYYEGKPIAWCNMGAKQDLPHFAKGEVEEGVASLFCFLVAKPYRGRGVARQLLAAALTYLANAGFKIAEAYPHTTASNEADKFHGTQSMYEQAGFKLHADQGEGRLVVRKRL